MPCTRKEALSLCSSFCARQQPGMSMLRWSSAIWLSLYFVGFNIISGFCCWSSRSNLTSSDSERHSVITKWPQMHVWVPLAKSHETCDIHLGILLYVSMFLCLGVAWPRRMCCKWECLSFSGTAAMLMVTCSPTADLEHVSPLHIW